MGISLRRATESDIDFIIKELKLFSEFYGSHHKLFPESEEEARYIIKMFVENHYFIVSENNGQLSGFIAGIEGNHAFNPSLKVLTEIFWWVKAEFRGTKAGAALLNEFNKHGEQFDWTIMTLEDNSPVNPEALLKRGYRNKEQSFIREKI